MEITDKLAMVTGGSRGIGRAIAIALAQAGADVIVNYKEHRAAAE
jgi:NAD(P)-dependent dehydrogenase (short-subunit alcohol dehydrogenase family)